MSILVLQDFTASGSFVVPANITMMWVAAWGPGANGSPGGIGGGAGGGAGAFAAKNVSCTPSDTWTVNIGADANVQDPAFATVVKAVAAVGSTGGDAASCIGTTKLSGADGGAGGASFGGGGGGSPGYSGVGSAGTDGDSGGAGGSGGIASAPFEGVEGADGGDHGNPAEAGALRGGGGGGGDVGAGTGGTGGGAYVLFFVVIGDPIDFGSRVYPIPHVSFDEPYPGAVIIGRSAFGIPPAAVASGSLSQFRAETEQPRPFPGQVIAIRPAMGETPPLPAGQSIATYRPPSDEFPPFPGAVLRALSTPFGIEALPARPVQVTTEQPTPYEGGVIALRGTVDIPPAPVPQPAVIRVHEPPPDISAPLFWSGVPARDAASRTAIIAGERPPEYGGEVIVGRSAFGVSPLPQFRPMVVSAPSVLEPGSVEFRAGREEEERIPPLPRIIRELEPVAEIPQPMFWSGTHERPAAYGTAAIVQLREETGEPGSVVASRSAFGLAADPARPVLVRMADGTEQTEPGGVLFSRPVESAPVMPPRAVVVWSDSVQEPGGVVFRRGESAPNVMPRTYLIAGETSWPEVVPSFFGWGWRTGSGAPPAPGAGFPVTLYGVDRGVITLTSVDGCDCY